jgi:hypothetical protein
MDKFGSGAVLLEKVSGFEYQSCMGVQYVSVSFLLACSKATQKFPIPPISGSREVFLAFLLLLREVLKGREEKKMTRLLTGAQVSVAISACIGKREKKLLAYVH